jgi:hypothetical protein
MAGEVIRLILHQVLDAACVVDRRIYLLFPSSLRLTLYSQQVRAILLVEALRSQDWMSNLISVAVVGGGASGITAAAALKVAGFRDELKVTLFENLERFLPLQSGCVDKVLTPYLIDWPAEGATRIKADLPILNWHKDSAAGVALELAAQFERFGIKRRTDTKVRRIENEGNAVALDIEARIKTGADPELVECRERYDLVIVAAGFGIEDPGDGLGSSTPSYWRVHPGAQPALVPQGKRKILISGLGDGGLIDFVLFACPGITHLKLCDDLSMSPDARALEAEIEAIEQAIWAAPNSIPDIAAAYQALNLDQLARTLVVPVLAHNIDFTLLTRNSQLFHRGTAPINRLAAMLVMRATELEDRGTSYNTVTDATLLADEDDRTVYAVGGAKTYGKYDEVVVRHGDTVTAAWDFSNADIAAKVQTLRNQRSAITARPTTPRLPAEVAERVEAGMFATLDTRIHVTRHGADIRWQGDLSPDDIGRVWHVPSAPLQIEIGFAPSGQYSKFDLAIVRLLAHAEPQAKLAGPHRDAWIELMAEVPRRAGDHTRPAVPRPGSVTPGRNEMSVEADQLADRLESSMDSGLLMLLDFKFKSLGTPATMCPVDLHPAIKANALGLWPEWVAAVRALSSQQRRWVLRLFGGLLNQVGQPDDWSAVRVGPKCTDEELVPGILYHLVMRGLLDGFGDAQMRHNGNVARFNETGEAMEAAHFSGSRWVQGEAKPIEIDDWEPHWAGPQWLPSCLILPGRRAEFLPAQRMTSTREDLRMLTRPWARAPVVIGSAELRQALRAGEVQARAALKAALTTPLPGI